MPYAIEDVNNLVFDYNDYEKDCDHFELDTNHADGLTYKKQLAYTGKFKKVKEGLAFEIDSGLLDHWKTESEKMLSEGVEIPLVKNHTEDPEHRRGDVIGFDRGTDSKGREALYCLARFADDEAAKVAKTAQVSLYSPKEVSTGQGNTYHYPVKHVAITDYPVIAGMERFEAIAASFDSQPDVIAANFPDRNPNNSQQNQQDNDPAQSSNNPPQNGPITQLAQTLGLQVEPNSNESQILNMIVMAFQALKQKAGLAQPQPNPMQPNPMQNPMGNPMVQQMQRPQIAAGFLSMAKENREIKLSNLVKSGRITSAVYKQLAERFLNDEDIAFSLSDDDTVANLSGFNDIIASLEQMPEGSALSLDEKTSLQSGDMKEFYLSFKDKEGKMKNPLLEDAERRAEQANKVLNP